MSLLPPLTPVMPTVVTRFLLFSLCTGTVPTLGGHPEKSISAIAQRRIDTLAKVTQLVIPLSSSDHASAVGAYGSESEGKGERFLRIPGVVRYP